MMPLPRMFSSMDRLMSLYLIGWIIRSATRLCFLVEYILILHLIAILVSILFDKLCIGFCRACWSELLQLGIGG